MKQDLRMNAKSPDPDDLSRELPESASDERGAASEGRHESEPAQRDRSAPHIPPMEKGKIKGEE